jgi:hypothetical protein
MIPDDVVWAGARFSADGQTLLVELTGLSDEVLAFDPDRPQKARPLLLEGDLPSDQVKTDLLGWIASDQVLATVHEASGTKRWQADADLAVLTLDLDAGTANVAVVGHVNPGDTGSAFSVATELLAVDIPTNHSRGPRADDPAAGTEPTGTSTDHTDSSEQPWLLLGAATLVLGAALVARALRRKRF